MTAYFLKEISCARFLLFTPKTRTFETKKKAQTLPKQVQNNFQKDEESTFFTPKIVKNDSSIRPKFANFWSKISIMEVIYRPLKLKIHKKRGSFKVK